MIQNHLMTMTTDSRRSFSSFLPIIFFLMMLPVLFTSCKSSKTNQEALIWQVPIGPDFNADSAFAYCQAQCDFGPRTMNSVSHDQCESWIIEKFKNFGCHTIAQKATLQGYDGTPLKSTNIIASTQPDNTTRVMICAHWDSRPWADNDPDSTKWHTPVLAANDGASGVAVMLELARQLQQADSLKVGVDFICFDAEDWGTPQWDNNTYPNTGEVWALGAEYWSKNTHIDHYAPRYGILLDMVGGQGAQFFQERLSKQYAQPIINKVWAAAKVVGFGSYFPDSTGEYITDDHVPVNTHANIPTIDVIPFYPDCKQSGFGPTWHTVNDDMQHIDKNTLKAVGQTLIQVLYSENRPHEKP